MGYEEISIKVKKTKEIAEKIKTQASETPYHRNELWEMIYGNRGDAYNGFFDVNSDTDICVNVTKQLMDCTARFLQNASDRFEELDVAIAQEVSTQ